MLRVPLLLIAAVGAAEGQYNPSTISCGGSFEYRILNGRDSWRPRLCSTGRVILDTCGHTGTLSDTYIYGGVCRNDDHRGRCGNTGAYRTASGRNHVYHSHCEGNNHGCTTLNIGSYSSRTGTATLWVTCPGYVTPSPTTRSPTDYPTTRSPTNYPTDYPTTLAPTCGCQAEVSEHYGHRGSSFTYVGPLTGPLHANTGNVNGQASTIRVTGTPGCEVRLYCHAGSYGCWFHANSQCHRTGNCADANGNWEEVLTVPSSGTLSAIIQHNDPRNAFINIRPCGGVGVSGDPFVTYMGKKTQVWLPLEKEVSLMQCDAATPWELRGTAFGSGVAGDSQQWFGSLALFAREAEQFLVQAGDEEFQVEVAPEPSFFNFTKGEKTAKVAATGVDLEFVYARVNKDSAGGRRHIDLKINTLDQSVCRGTLPEIWGLQPMSEATVAMLLPPKSD